jgi:hypothetical protein
VLNDQWDKDNHTCIERHRERPGRAKQAAEAREVEKSALRYGRRCLAFVPELPQVAWPKKFRPYIPVKYDESTNPTDFLQVYSIAIVAADGDVKIMAN